MNNKTLASIVVAILSVLLLSALIWVGGMAAASPERQAAGDTDSETPEPDQKGDPINNQVSLRYEGPVNRQIRQPETSSAAGWVTIKSEDFEGAFPNSWDVADQNPDGGEYYWEKRNCRPYQGSYSGWGVGGGAQGSSLGCGSNYPNDSFSWMIYGPFSLADATDAELQYSLWFNTEQDFDFLWVVASIDGSDYYGGRWSGSRDWGVESFDLTDVYTLGDLTGEPQVWIAFIFSSDDSVTEAEGAYLDDILLQKYVPSAMTDTPTPTATSTQTPTATSTPTPTPTGTVEPSEWVNLVYEDFEGDFPYDWTVFDDNGPDYGEYQWGKRDCRAYSGGYSGWGVGGGYDGSNKSCGTVFPTNAASWMIYGPFSLEDAVDGEFSFMRWLNTDPAQEDPFDYIFYGASVDGIEFFGRFGWGDSGGWQQVNFDLKDVYTLGNLMDEPEVWVAIIFTSDGNAANDLVEGVFVDDVMVRVKRQSSAVPDQQLFLPFSLKNAATYFEGPWEVEPNNNPSQANGHLLSGRTYYGRHNDAADYYKVYLNTAGTLTVNFDSQLVEKDNQGNYVIQVQLKNEMGERLDYKVGPDEQITKNVPAGIYYIYIYTRLDYANPDKQYSLVVNYP